MTEPPRPPGDGSPSSDPTAPFTPAPGGPPPGYAPPPSFGTPPPDAGTGDLPPAPPAPGAGGYPPPPGSGAGGYPPPGGATSGGYPGGESPPSYGSGGPGAAPGYAAGSGYGPGPGYGPAPGYGPGPGYGPAPGYGGGNAIGDEKAWAMIAHFGGILVGFIAPLLVMLLKGSESPNVRAHAVEALNFQITWGVATIVMSVLAACSFGILFFLPLLTIAVVVVCSLIAGLKANDGQLYRYPMTVRPIK